MSGLVNIGVIGFGYWGPNVARNFNSVQGARVVAICDRDKAALERAAKTYADSILSCDYRDVTRDKNIDAVAIVTPVSTHYELAADALKHGKHIFIEKPFCASSTQAQRLIKLADNSGLVIMVDHTFLFTGAVIKIKELIDNGALGSIYYYDSTRVNLGLFQHDVNVIWDLAAHDFSIMDHILEEKPVAISAQGAKHLSGRGESIAYITAHFKNSLIAHFNINWLSPVKVRTAIIGGEKKMLVWNDLEADEKIKIYDKGVEIKNKQGMYNLLVEYRSGDMFAPRIDHAEALKLEAQYFLECITKNRRPFNDGESGLWVVRMLEAADASLKNKGAAQKI